MQSCSSRSSVLNLEQKYSGHRLQLVHCTYLQLQCSYFESMQRTGGSGEFRDRGSVPKVLKGRSPRFLEVGTSFGSSKSKGMGQQGSVFRGCTKAQKNTENYYKNIS